jgi:hypothetical protein
VDGVGSQFVVEAPHGVFDAEQQRVPHGRLHVGGEAVGIGRTAFADEVIRVDQVDGRVVAGVEWSDPAATVLTVRLQQQQPRIQEPGMVRVAERRHGGDVVVAELLQPPVRADAEPLSHGSGQQTTDPPIDISGHVDAARFVVRDVEQAQARLVPEHHSPLPRTVRGGRARVSDRFDVGLEGGEREIRVQRGHGRIVERTQRTTRAGSSCPGTLADPRCRPMACRGRICTSCSGG